MEDCKSTQPLLPSTVNPRDNEIAESAEGESRRLGDKIADFEPCPTFLSPHSLDAANRLSPGLGVTSPGPLAAARGSSPQRGQVSAAGCNSGRHPSSPSVTNPNLEKESPTPMTLPSGKSGITASAIDRHGEEGLPGRKAVSGPPNEYESRVVPDEHSIVDDALLKCTPYIVNTKYMVLICTDCRYCIIPDRASKHLREDHPHCKVDTSFSEQLSQRFPGLAAETIHPAETIEAVFGLAISIKEYTVCSRCRRGYSDVYTWERHICRNADTDLAGRCAHFSSRVQTFFRGQKICYFPVEVPPVSTNSDDFDLFKTDFQEIAVSEGEIHEAEDYRELNQFLLKEGWIDHVSGCSPSELSLLTCLPKEDQVLKSTASDVVGLMSNIQTAIGTAGYHVRRLLGRRPAYVLSNLHVFIISLTDVNRILSDK